MYNYNNVLKCIETVKALNTTAFRKADKILENNRKGVIYYQV